jgi:hypothetical protein
MKSNEATVEQSLKSLPEDWRVAIRAVLKVVLANHAY